uniref:Uncharacterized protein n=1 Tax=Romanomermis culicivorax TaxID=13658 RepID=A0A915K225_ROMCU
MPDFSTIMEIKRPRRTDNPVSIRIELCLAPVRFTAHGRQISFVQYSNKPCQFLWRQRNPQQ